MDWEKMGTEMPVADEKGNRPPTNEKGQARETELVVYQPTDYLEFKVDDMAKGSDRRFLESLTDNLARQKPSSPGYATDFDVSLSMVCMKFIRAVNDTADGREYKGEEIVPFLLEELEYDDSLQLLYWLRTKASLARSKKKNSKRQSG